jgi:hypothetical protein
MTSALLASSPAFAQTPSGWAMTNRPASPMVIAPSIAVLPAQPSPMPQPYSSYPPASYYPSPHVVQPPAFQNYPSYPGYAWQVPAPRLYRPPMSILPNPIPHPFPELGVMVHPYHGRVTTFGYAR